MGKAINVGGAPTAPGRPDNVVELARALGESDRLPTKQLTDTPALIAQEQDLYLKCESAIENLRFAFWAAGKALQVVRDARLYRAEFDTFEEYTQTKWDITPQYAGKLIRTWRVAEALFHAKPGGGLETIVSKKLGYGQAWALVPLVEKHSVQAAVYLYLGLLKVKGSGVTAAIVQGAVEALPTAAIGHKAKTEDAVLAYLNSLEEASTPELSTPDPVKALRALNKATKALDLGSVKAALQHDPERTLTAVKSLIETLSSAAGVTVSFDAEAASDAPTEQPAGQHPESGDARTAVAA
jgi:hypothetical protein